MTVYVSIHAPLRGATRQGRLSTPTRWFQSTRPCGARPCTAGRFYNGLSVSIHAPLRGATLDVLVQLPPQIGFNPRAPAGRDSFFAYQLNVWSQFQSTRPCGARLSLRPPRGE